jgi:hypothetical protein
MPRALPSLIFPDGEEEDQLEEGRALAASIVDDGSKMDKRGRRNRIRPKNWGYTTYLDKVFSMHCFAELVRLRVFPDCKDISESYGVLQAAIRRGLRALQRHDRPQQILAEGKRVMTRDLERLPGVLCVCIGDGASARTAALVAFLTNWYAVSVDPALRPEWTGKEPHGVRRLRGFARRFEELMADPAAVQDMIDDISRSAEDGASGGTASESDADLCMNGGSGNNVRVQKDEVGPDEDDSCSEPSDAEILKYTRIAHRADFIFWLEGRKSDSESRDSSIAAVSANSSDGNGDNSSIENRSLPKTSVSEDGVGAAYRLVDEEWGHTLYDPRRYDSTTLRLFWRWNQVRLASELKAKDDSKSGEEKGQNGNKGYGSGSQEVAQSQTQNARLNKRRRTIEDDIVAKKVDHGPDPPIFDAFSSSGCSRLTRHAQLLHHPVQQLVLLGVHSHHRYSGSAANVEAIRSLFAYPQTVLVALPCCHQFNPTADVGRAPDEDYEDVAIFSEKRRVLVWRWQRGPANNKGEKKPGHCSAI